MDEPSSTETGAITLRIKFKSESLDDFVAKYGADVSAGGIFIRTKQPLAVGTLLNFEFSLADSSLLMSGLGTVVWLREYDPARPSSVPGMGLRFDQLSPESQTMHQQLLAQKARREGKAAASAPLSGSGSNKALPRQSGSSPLLATTQAGPAVTGMSEETMSALEEFDSGGKTEIANHPPSFFFEAADKARAAGETTRPSSPQPDGNAPAGPLEDWQTDAHGLGSQGNTVAANSLDLGWTNCEQGGPPSPDAPVAPMDDVVMQTGDTRTSAADLPRAALLDLPMGDEASSLPEGGSFAEPVPTETLSLDSSAIETIKAGPEDAAPEEAPEEKTDQVTSVPAQAPIEQSSRAANDDVRETAASRDEKPGEGDLASAEVEAVAAGAGALVDKPKRRQGKALVILGLAAAVAAFAGVYLLQAKPWRSASEVPSATAPVPPATPTATPTPVAEPKPAEAKPTEVPAPPAEAAPAPAAKPAEPKPTEAVEASPAPTPTPTPAPEAKPATVKVVAAEPKPEEVAEKAAAKEPSRPAASKKPVAKSSEKASEKSGEPTPASASAPAPSGEVKYILKVKSVPAGGDVLIDGERMGPTPFQRRILDITKPHSVAIQKPGYEPHERMIGASDNWIVKGEDAVLTVTAKLTKIKAAEPAAAPSEAKPATSDEPSQP